MVVTPLHHGHRSAGAVSVHGGSVVHGVSPVTDGVRYSLFLLQRYQNETVGNRQRGNAWLTHYDDDHYHFQTQ